MHPLGLLAEREGAPPSGPVVPCNLGNLPASLWPDNPLLPPRRKSRIENSKAALISADRTASVSHVGWLVGWLVVNLTVSGRVWWWLLTQCWNVLQELSLACRPLLLFANLSLLLSTFGLGFVSRVNNPYLQCILTCKVPYCLCCFAFQTVCTVVPNGL